MTDRELLTAYQKRHSADDFAQLVAMHINLVYSVARRHTKDAHMAEDITQEVFLTLARKARMLKPETLLAGWLFTTTRLLSLQSLRAKARRTHYETEAVMSQGPLMENDPTWPLIADEIDKAVADLSQTEREAILLRFFSGKSNPEIATILAISEEAAKKRVQRSLESLQKLLTSRGLGTTSAVTAVTLGTMLSTHAVHAAPSALASSITKTVVLKATTFSTLKGAIMAMKLKTAVVVSALAVAVTASTVTAVHFSKSNVAPAGVSSIEGTVPVAADATTQPDAAAPADPSWKGWGVGAYPAVSPFQAVRWNGDTPEVEVKDTWYQLVTLNGIPAEQIVASAKSADREWQMRFGEDLVALLAYMGHEPGAMVNLELKNLQTQKVETQTDVPMTKENRAAIYEARTAPLRAVPQH